ncbi:uncharacterized protein LOC120634338 isoform X2 [Pararge aegeria]|uniref:uncharacterized protein LOC120634338 isoform X2 n=1 Tax=Pararge aegeria TaxID=116150 RepID=UPI0019D0595F|nr:uncharacterized protein LOC120634338 isoform X2 [Pararge aegeria]
MFVKFFSMHWMSTLCIARTRGRTKRSNAENFKVLLNIYKINPLKHSNVFKTFSNRILLPAPDEHRTALNFNINESSEKENSTNTKVENGQVINYATHKSIDRPLYIEEETPEKLEPEYFLNKLVSINSTDFNYKENDDRYIFNDNLVQNSTSQSKSLQNDIIQPEKQTKGIAIEKFSTIKDKKVMNSDDNKEPNDVAETVVI